MYRIIAYMILCAVYFIGSAVQKTPNPQLFQCPLIDPLWNSSCDTIRQMGIERGIKMELKEEELNGTRRFLASHLLAAEECLEILDLQHFASLGSGYGGLASPHTPHEHFFGADLNELLTLVKYKSAISAHVSKITATLINKAELIRQLAESYFEETNGLFLDYIHFACRKPINEGSNDREDDFSHAIHADNCHMANGVCIRRPRAFYWRDYSAVLFLADNFDGGEFVFADTNKTIVAEIKPACGQAVIFAGENLHGVRAVTRGVRCALAIWMTKDPDRENKALRLWKHFLLAKPLE